MAKNRLSELIKEKGYTQKEFAEMVGTTPQYINAVGTGRLTLSIRQLNRFAELLGVPVGELLTKPTGSHSFHCPHCGKVIFVSTTEGAETEEEMD